MFAMISRQLLSGLAQRTEASVRMEVTDMATDKNQLQLPDWVNNDFFAECLQKEMKKDTAVVTNFTTSTVVPPGNNYGSFIIRAKVEYKYRENDTELQTISLIIKSELLDPLLKEMSKSFNKNEPFFYYSFLPKASELGETCFAPKCFFSPRPTVTVLEDLKDKSFIMADRLKQLDFDHCRLYMTAAAAMHAVSVAALKHHPEMLDQFNTPLMFNGDNSLARVFFKPFINMGMKFFIDEVEKNVPYNRYGELLRKTAPNLWEMLVKMHKPNDGINTIRQGDPWTTNMMFKYDEQGKPCDIKIIDFQAVQYGGPADDIIFFIWSSANNDVKKNRLQELYRVYVDTFNAKLKQCKCDERLSYQQFVADVRKGFPQALFLAASMIPVFLHPEPMDFALLLSKETDEKEHLFRKYYDHNFCNEYLPVLLECLEVNGVFDYLQHYEP